MPPVLKPPPVMLLNDPTGKGLVQVAAPPEKPHTTVYVGKIASTVEDEFLRAILEVGTSTSLIFQTMDCM
jgi:RNA-binding protein 25